MEELKRQWGRNVALCRKALNHDGQFRGDDETPMSQARLAELCDVKQQTISSIERGEYAPRDRLKVRIAEVLRQDVFSLFPLTRSVA